MQGRWHPLVGQLELKLRARREERVELIAEKSVVAAPLTKETDELPVNFRAKQHNIPGIFLRQKGPNAIGDGWTIGTKAQLRRKGVALGNRSGVA